MLSASQYPDLPGMVLADPRADQFKDQVVFLDFDGAADVTFNGLIVVEGIDVPAFEAPGQLAGLEGQIISDVLGRLEATFAGTGIIFTTAHPDLSSSFSTVLIGGDDSAFREHGSFIGLAETIDIGNQINNDNAYVFSEHVPLDALADTVAHEIGHLLGYKHVHDAIPGDDIRDYAQDYKQSLRSNENNPTYGSYSSSITVDKGSTHRFIVDGVYGTSESLHYKWYSTNSGESGLLASGTSYTGNNWYDPTISRTFNSTGSYVVRAEIWDRTWTGGIGEWWEAHRWHVTVVEPPDLDVDRSSIDFDYDDSSKYFYVQNDGGGTLDYQITDNVDWLTYSRTSGSTSSSSKITVYLDRNEMAWGNNQSATITVRNSNNSSDYETISVTADNPDPDPTASRHNPTQSSITLDFNTNYTFQARGRDDGGDLDYADWTLSGPENDTDHDAWTHDDDRISNYSHRFDVAGDYTLTCTFTDESGDTASVSWSIHVNKPPKPDLVVSDLSGSQSSGYPGQNITITSVTKNVGEADTGWNKWSKVRYYLGRTSGALWREIGWGWTPNLPEINGISVGEEEPDQITWTIASDLSVGRYYITAVADADDDIDEDPEDEFDSRTIVFDVTAPPQTYTLTDAAIVPNRDLDADTYHSRFDARWSSKTNYGIATVTAEVWADSFELGILDRKVAEKTYTITSTDTWQSIDEILTTDPDPDLDHRTWDFWVILKYAGAEKDRRDAGDDSDLNDVQLELPSEETQVVEITAAEVFIDQDLDGDTYGSRFDLRWRTDTTFGSRTVTAIVWADKDNLIDNDQEVARKTYTADTSNGWQSIDDILTDNIVEGDLDYGEYDFWIQIKDGSSVLDEYGVWPFHNDDEDLNDVRLELPSEEFALSYRSGPGIGDGTVASIHAGEIVYLRADAPGMIGQTIDVQIWEDDGFGDDLITTKSITIDSSGYGTVEWVASWQSLDANDPQNMYYLYYGAGNIFSGAANTGHFNVQPTPWSGNSNDYTTWLSRDWEGLPDPPEGEIELRIHRRFEDGVSIDSSQSTWVVTHGWTDHFYPGESFIAEDDRNDDSMYNLAQAAYESAKDLDMQLLTLDWNEGASRTDVLDGSAELWIPVVAEAASYAFDVMGFASASLNLLGQSYGAVLSGELAARLQGDVNTIVALDPANNHPDTDAWGYNTESVDFAAHSDYSWAFLTSQFGSGDTVPTADASFMVDIIGDNWTNTWSHSHAKTLYEEILRRNHKGTAGPFSSMFGLASVLSHSSPWLHDLIDADAFTGSWLFPGEGDDAYNNPQYEAVLHFQASDDELTLTPLSVEYIAAAGDRDQVFEVDGDVIRGLLDFESSAGQIAEAFLDYVTPGGIDTVLSALAQSDLGLLPNEDSRAIHVGVAIGIDVGTQAELAWKALQGGHTISYNVNDHSWTIASGITLSAVFGDLNAEMYLKIPENASSITAGVGLSGSAGLAGLTAEAGVEIPIGGIVTAEIQTGISGEIGSGIGVNVERLLEPAEFLLEQGMDGGDPLVDGVLASLTPYGDDWWIDVASGVGSLFAPFGSIAMRYLIRNALSDSTTPLGLVANAFGDPSNPLTITAAAQTEAGATLSTKAGIGLGITVVELGVNVVASYTESVAIPLGYEQTWLAGDVTGGDIPGEDDDHGDTRFSASNFTDVLNFSTFGTFETSGDVDWIRVSAAADQELWYYTDQAPGWTTPPDMALFTADGTFLSNAVTTGERSSLHWVAPETGDYLVRISHPENETGAYSLLLGEYDLDPVAEIVSISPNPAQPPNETVCFDGDGTGMITAGGAIQAWEWTSDIDGTLSNDEDFCISANELTVGDHTISLRVQDEDYVWSNPIAGTLSIPDASPTAELEGLPLTPVAPGTQILLALGGHDNDEGGLSLASGRLRLDGSVIDTPLPGVYPLTAPSTPGSHTVSYEVMDDEGTWSSPVSEAFTVEAATATIVDRQIFYSNSSFDGVDDDMAIASDKRALLPGETASFTNYTSYSRGINGIMVDVSDIQGAPALSDFEFRIGNDDNPSGWEQLTAPRLPNIDVVLDGGGVGVERIVLTWADNEIENTWLEVTVLSNANGGGMGLTQDEVFYFGNAIGETGNDGGNAFVDGSDYAAVRDDPHNFLNPAPIDNPHDFNRDKFVDGSDLAIVRDNNTNFLNDLNLIEVPPSAPPAISPPSVATASSDGVTAGQQQLVAASAPAETLIPSASTRSRVSASETWFVDSSMVSSHRMLSNRFRQDIRGDFQSSRTRAADLLFSDFNGRDRVTHDPAEGSAALATEVSSARPGREETGFDVAFESFGLRHNGLKPRFGSIWGDLNG